MRTFEEEVDAVLRWLDSEYAHGDDLAGYLLPWVQTYARMARMYSERYPLHDVRADVRNLLVRKRKAYGKHNLDKHGLFGIQVRVDDKLARLDNLMGLSPAGEQLWLLEDERIVDTVIDVIGYCVAAIMLMDNTWGLDGEED